jgi:ribosomal protein S27E
MTDTTDPVSARRLDGNAAGGPLAALFAVDVTAARSRCAACGSTSALGEHLVYADAPAMVVRCPSCTEVVLRVASREGRMLLDLSGAALLTVPMPVVSDADT